MRKAVYLFGLQTPREDDKFMNKLWVAPPCAPPVAGSALAKENKMKLRRFANGFKDEVCPPVTSSELHLVGWRYVVGPKSGNILYYKFHHH